MKQCLMILVMLGLLVHVVHTSSKTDDGTEKSATTDDGAEKSAKTDDGAEKSEKSSSILKYIKVPKRCKKGGDSFKIGDKFIDPSDSCRICQCCVTGFKCTQMDCTKNTPECGKNHHEVTNNECCPTCSNACKETTCEQLECAATYYGENDCCPSCGCYFRGMVHPEGPITTSPTAECEGCVCSDGEVTCANKAPCPEGGNKCIDPVVFNDTCKWTCPNGKTCFRGDTKIMPSEYKIFPDKVCYCLKGTDIWYPLAACSNINHWGKFEQKLYVNMCMKRPEHPQRWEDE